MNKQDAFIARPNAADAFVRLKDILDTLRQECPWDKKQTIDSLRKLTIEEVYELSEAIIDGDMQEIKKELGDVFLHLLFYAKIADENGFFDIADVLNQQCDKLIQRHPHIYGDTVAADEEAVKRNWEQIKLNSGNKHVLQGVPNGLPAMVKAMRVQEKAHGVGFDWPDIQGVLAKVQEELTELHEAINENNQTNITEEIGDLLFSIINAARFSGIDAEAALEATNRKFIKRFTYIEDKAKEQDLQINSLTLAQMEQYWQEAKKK